MGWRFTHKILKGYIEVRKLAKKNYVMFMWVGSQGIFLITGTGPYRAIQAKEDQTGPYGAIDHLGANRTLLDHTVPNGTRGGYGDPQIIKL